jgi:hypothetical protein
MEGSTWQRKAVHFLMARKQRVETQDKIYSLKNMPPEAYVLHLGPTTEGFYHLLTVPSNSDYVRALMNQSPLNDPPRKKSFNICTFEGCFISKPYTSSSWYKC